MTLPSKTDFVDGILNNTLFFDVRDQRYEKKLPNTKIMTCNTTPRAIGMSSPRATTRCCALDRLFNKGHMFIIKGADFRGTKLEVFSIGADTIAVKTLD